MTRSLERHGPTGWRMRKLPVPVLGRLMMSLAAATTAGGLIGGSADVAVRLRLRVALHVGPVASDAEGVSGEAIIHTARLLEAPPLKAGLAGAAADLGFIASTFVYDNVIRHELERAAPDLYQVVRTQVKESVLSGWMRLLGAAPAA